MTRTCNAHVRKRSNLTTPYHCPLHVLSSIGTYMVQVIDLSMEREKESSASVEASKSDQLAEGKEDEEGSTTDEQTRLWAAVKEKPSDFTSWTSLLQMVEQKVPLLNIFLLVAHMYTL